MKKFLAAFLCAAVAIGLTACSDNTKTPDDDKSVSSKKDKDNSSDGENNKPAENEDDFEWKDLDGGVVITNYKGSEKNVVIPSALGGKPVKQIGSAWNGFKDNTDITSVTIPDSVTKIGDLVFDDCKNIQATYKGKTYKYANRNALYKAINGN